MDAVYVCSGADEWQSDRQPMTQETERRGLWLCREALRQLIDCGAYGVEFRPAYYAVPIRDEVELRPISFRYAPILRARVFCIDVNDNPCFEFHLWSLR